MNKRNKDTNPFPSTAVARLAKGASGLLSIETKALVQLRSYLEDYVKRQDQNGQIISLIGEYGTGKTHLALEALRFIESQEDEKIHAFYLDAPSDNFLELYLKRFIPSISRKELVERVEEYYADIVAQELERDEIYKDVVKDLRGRKIEASEVVKSIGLKESKLKRLLEEKLKSVTENPIFAYALLLIKDSAFERMVWDWFCGSAPQEVLQERGIDNRIDNDATALETIGVLSFLFGRQHHRFVLIIDEIEKVFTSSQSIHESSLLAFKKLFETISQTKGLLILSGLPDFYEALPADAQERISIVLRPTELSSEEISQYIKRANKLAIGKEVLKPFTSSTIRYISEMTGGNARQIIRLCYHLYHRAISENRSITQELVREIIAELFGISKKTDVVSEISQILDSRGWLYDKSKTFSHDDKKETVDFWLPSGEDGDGVVVFLPRNVFSEKDINDLQTTLNLVTSSQSGSRVFHVVVMAGFISEKGNQALLNDPTVRLLSYSTKHFISEFESLINGLKIRIEEESKEDKLSHVSEKIEQLERQLTSITSFIRHELATEKRIRTLNDQNLRHIRNEFRKLQGFNKRREYPQTMRTLLRTIEDIDRTIFGPLNLRQGRRVLMSQLNIFSHGNSHKETLKKYFFLKELAYMNYNLTMSLFNNNYKNRPFDDRSSFDELMHFYEREVHFALLKQVDFDSIDLSEFEQMQERKLRKNFDTRVTYTYEKFKSLMKEFPVALFLNLQDIRPPRHIPASITSTDLDELSLITGELGDLFVTLVNRLMTVDKLILDSILHMVTNFKRRIKSFETAAESLMFFYSIKNLTWFFIKTVSSALNDRYGASVGRVRMKDLFMFCEYYEHEVLYSVMSDKTSLDSLFRFIGDPTDYEYRRDYEFEIKRTIEDMEDLPRMVRKLLDHSDFEERGLLKF